MAPEGIANKNTIMFLKGPENTAFLDGIAKPSSFRNYQHYYRDLVLLSCREEREVKRKE